MTVWHTHTHTTRISVVHKLPLDIRCCAFCMCVCAVFLFFFFFLVLYNTLAARYTNIYTAQSNRVYIYDVRVCNTICGWRSYDIFFIIFFIHCYLCQMWACEFVSVRPRAFVCVCVCDMTTLATVVCRTTIITIDKYVAWTSNDKWTTRLMKANNTTNDEWHSKMIDAFLLPRIEVFFVVGFFDGIVPVSFRSTH